MTESVARLRGEQLTLGYGKYTVAENLTVEIPDGHFTAIIGPNGCGKSTLLRTLSRLMTPAHGHVWLDGEHIQHYASKEVARRIGLLAQNATTPGDITVQELVARGRYPHQPLFTRWRKEDEDAVTKAMQATGITHLADQSVDTLSGGQRQRAWIAMVLAQETAIMLLDEPTTGVDAVSRSEFWDMLSELKSKGISMLVSTPYMDEARRCDRIALCNEGKILGIDTPQGIVGRFDGPLYALSGRDMYGLLLAARRSSGVRECYPFGEAHHLIPADGFDAAAFARELAGQGFPDAVIRPAEAGIEDVFIKLMHHEP